MQMLHPFMPFVTEEIYHLLRERQPGDDLCVSRLPADSSSPAGTNGKSQSGLLAEGLLLKDAITGIRDARNRAKLKPRDTVRISCQSKQEAVYRVIASILCKQVNAESIDFSEEKPDGSIPVVIGKDRFFLTSDQLGSDEGQETEWRKELEHLERFLESVEKKLGNERFMQNAKPEVIELERKKRSDAMEKIRTIRESLTNPK
jgi:valyl-tRNA synthetase